MRSIARALPSSCLHWHRRRLPVRAKPSPSRSPAWSSCPGTGATSGTNFNDGVKLAVKEINAAGGILGPQDRVHGERHAVAAAGRRRRCAVKAIDDSVYVVMGPVFSGSILVSMAETQARRDPELHRRRSGGDHAAGQSVHLPHVVHAERPRCPRWRAIIKDNLEGEDRRDDLGEQRLRQGRTRRVREGARGAGHQGRRRHLDRSGPARFLRARCSKAKQANADALFVYSNEEESARALRELRKQGYDKPIVGETVLTSQKVIELAGRRRQRRGRARRAHRGCAAVRRSRRSRRNSRRNTTTSPTTTASRATAAMYIVKAVTEKIGKVDSEGVRRLPCTASSSRRRTTRGS